MIVWDCSRALAANQTLYDHDADQNHDWRKVEPGISQAHRGQCSSQWPKNRLSDEMEEAVEGGDNALGIDWKPAQDDAYENDKNIRVEQRAEYRHS